MTEKEKEEYKNFILKPDFAANVKKIVEVIRKHANEDFFWYEACDLANVKFNTFYYYAVRLMMGEQLTRTPYKMRNKIIYIYNYKTKQKEISISFFVQTHSNKIYLISLDYLIALLYNICMGISILVMNYKIIVSTKKEDKIIKTPRIKIKCLYDDVNELFIFFSKIERNRKK